MKVYGWHFAFRGVEFNNKVLGSIRLISTFAAKEMEMTLHRISFVSTSLMQKPLKCLVSGPRLSLLRTSSFDLMLGNN